MNGEVANRDCQFATFEDKVFNREVDGGIGILLDFDISGAHARLLVHDCYIVRLCEALYRGQHEVVCAKLNINNLAESALHVDVDGNVELLIVHLALQVEGYCTSACANHRTHPHFNAFLVARLNHDVAHEGEVIQTV